MPYQTRFVTFAVKRGMESQADEWIRVLTVRRAECVETLDREKMHFESIFNGRTYLSWISLQGLRGEDVCSSPHPVDAFHMEMWDKCIDPEVAAERFEHLISFVPDSVWRAVEMRDGAP